MSNTKIREEVQMKTKEEMGRSMRVKRMVADMKQWQAAKELGIAPNTLSSWERGNHSLRIVEAWALADLYGCTLDELVGRETAAKEG